MLWAVLILVAILIALDKSLLPGTGILAVGLLANILPAKQATGVTLALLILADWTAIWAYRDNVDWAALRRLLPNVVVGVLAGAAFLFIADDTATRRVVGIIILVFIAGNVAKMWRDHPPRHSATTPAGAPSSLSPSPSTEPAAGGAKAAAESRGRRLKGAGYGALAGFTTMVANAGGPVTAMYFITEGFSVRRFLGTTAWFYLVLNLVKLPFSIGLGMLTTQYLGPILAMIPVIVATVLVGRRLSGRIDRSVFNVLVVILTVVTGVMLLVR